MAAAIAFGTVGNAARIASPMVLKRTPSCAAIASRSRAKWRSTAAAIAARSRSQSAVLPSMSVKRKVTVPLGRSGIVRLQNRVVQELHGDCRTCLRPHRGTTSPVLMFVADPLPACRARGEVEGGKWEIKEYINGATGVTPSREVMNGRKRRGSVQRLLSESVVSASHSPSCAGNLQPTLRAGHRGVTRPHTLAIAPALAG